MNPGGDYGKKELSPALRNRFTEIWVPPVDNPADLAMIIDSSWQHERLKPLTAPLLAFRQWLRERLNDHSVCTLRDMLAWAAFSNAVVMQQWGPAMHVSEIFHHAARMTFLDGLGSLVQTVTRSPEDLLHLRDEATRKLEGLIPLVESTSPHVCDISLYVQFGPFAIPKGPEVVTIHDFNFQAPTTRDNVIRVVRACQLDKPILLEGSPGVGKTSLVAALAKITGYRLCRVNLSDQTDLIDLFGSDLPVESGSPGQFAWKDAEFLRAMQEGYWVLLDEMNLAPQTVLEGLNAILDHRGTVFIPELGRTFVRHPSFRVFAAQNPLHQGGGRKGLPKSFLDRFTKVYLEELSSDDMFIICRGQFKDFEEDLLRAMITFNAHLNHSVVQQRLFGREGSPWEFNLRDIIRWGELFHASTNSNHPGHFLRTVYLSRFRNSEDRSQARAVFKQIFATSEDVDMPVSYPLVSASYLQIGHFNAPRGRGVLPFKPTDILQVHLTALESVWACLSRSWLVIVTGPRGTGKSSLIRTMANLSGNPLEEIAITIATDTSDILGGFEQVDHTARVMSIAAKILKLADDSMQSAQGVQYRYRHHNTLQLEMVSPLRTRESILRAASQLLEELLKVAAYKSEFDTSLQHLRTSVAMLAQMETTSGHFEWVDGPLVRAMKQGHWLVLDNANMCNPSVLDRLNSLCEPNGVLILGERGFVDGKVEVLKPHPNFRLFMTVDPQHGELSRAMRNRGLEVSLLHSFKTEDRSRVLAYCRLPECAEISSHPTYEERRRGLTNPSVGSAKPMPPVTTPDDTISTYLTAFTPIINSGDGVSLFAIIPFVLRAFPPSLLPAMRRYLAATSAGNIFTIFDDHALSHTGAALSRVFKLPTTGIMEKLTDVLPLDDFMPCPPCSRCAPEYRHVHILRLQILDLFAALVADKFDRSQRTSFPTPYLIKMSETLTETIKDILREIPAAAQGLFERFMSSADGLLREDFDISVKLLGCSRRLRRVLLGDCFDYSTAQVLTREISAILENSSPIYGHIVAASAALNAAVSSSSGLGLVEIWSRLRTERTAEFDPGIIRQLESNVQVAALDKERKSLHFRTLALATLPITISSDRSVEVANISCRIREHLSSTVPNTVTSLGRASCNPVSLLVELQAICSTENGKLSKDTFSRLIEVALDQSSEDLRRFVAYQHVIWARDIVHDIPPNIMATLLTNLLYGPGIIFHPIYLVSIVEKCQLTKISLSSLEEHEASVQRLMKLVIQQCYTTRSRFQQLTMAFNKSLGMLASCFTNCFDHEQLQLISDKTYGTDMDDATVLLNLFGRSSSQPLRKASQHFVPALQCHVSGSLGMMGIAHLGQCWIAQSRVLLDLFVPDVPVDPAAILQRSAEFFREDAQLVADQIMLHTYLENRRAGNNMNSVISHLAARYQEYTNLAQLPPALPHRSDISNLRAFWSEVSQFIRQIIHYPKIDDLILALETDGDSAYNREDLVQESITGFVQRLVNLYPGFEDIICVLRLAFSQLQLGLRLVRHGFEHKNLDVGAMTYAKTLVVFPPSQSASLLQRPLSIGNGISAAEHLLLAVAAGVKCYRSKGPTLSIEMVQTTYEQLYRLWTIDRARDDKMAQDLGSLYRGGAVSHDANSEAELEEKEFLELFPTFEDALLPMDAGTAGRPADGVSHHLNPSQHHQLLALHLELMGLRDIDRCQFDGIRHRVLGSYLSLHVSSLTESLDHDALHDQISLLHAHLALLRGITSQTQSKNFYTDTNIPEARKALTIVQTLRTRIVAMLREWPDQMILQHLLTRCDVILGFDINSPVAKLLSAFEQLLLQTEDWEMYANRENSLKEHQFAITDLVVAWRRLELTCWRGLLESESKMFADGVAEYWFRLYELLIWGPSRAADGDEGLTKYLQQLPSLLDDFIKTSSLGQFQTRLDLLKSFEILIGRMVMGSSHCQSAVLDPVRCIIHFSWRYYNLFAVQISQSLRDQRGALEKEIDAFVKLASWRDVNVQALKQSARKTHHQLFKIIRKFRDVMRQSIACRLAPTFSDSAEDVRQTDQPLLRGSRNLSSSVHLPDMTHAAASLPAHFENLGKTYEKFHGYINLHIRTFLRCYLPYDVEHLCATIIQTVKDLASESIPGELSKEKREKYKKNLFTRKRKAWSDLQKELRRGGLTHHVTPTTSDHLRDECWIRRRPLMPSTGDVIPTERGEMYFDRLRGCLPALQDVLGGHHSDLNTRDLRRGVSLVESGYSLALETRSMLSDALSGYTTIRHQLTRLQAIAVARTSVRIDSAGQVDSLCGALEVSARALNELADGIRLFLQAQDGSNVTVLIQELHTLCLSLCTARDRITEILLVKQSIMPTVLLEEEHIAVVEASDLLHSTLSRLGEMTLSFPQLAYILHPTAQWIRDQGTFSFPSEGTFSSQPISDVNSVIDSVLLVVQTMLEKCPEAPKEEASTTSPIDQPIDGYIRCGARTTSLFTSLLDLRGVSERISCVAMELAPLPHPLLQIQLQQMLPFLQSFVDFSEDLLQSQARWTTELFKLDYIVCSVVHTLATRGFCIPPEAEEDQTAGNEQGRELGGTGIGEGAGTENISKEIEDESQVEGLKGDDGEETERGGKNDENMIEMSEDFEEDLEDVSDKEDERQDDKDSQQGDEAFDEQLGNLDKSDPNVVDEKLWGDEAGIDDGQNQDDELAQDRSEQKGQSEVVAKEGDRTKKDNKVDQENSECEEEMDDVDKNEAEGEEQEAPGKAGAPMDEYVPDANTLDLPEDMDLDGTRDQEDKDELDLVEDAIDNDDQDKDDQMDQDEDIGHLDSVDEPSTVDDKTQSNDQPHVADDPGPDEAGMREDGKEKDDGAVARPDLASGNGDTGLEDDASKPQDDVERGQEGAASALQACSPDNEETKSMQVLHGSQMPLTNSFTSTTEVPSPRQNPQPTTQSESQSQPTTEGNGLDGVQLGFDYSQHPPTSSPTSDPLRKLGDALNDIQRRFDEIFGLPEHTRAEIKPRPDDVEHVVYEHDENDQDGMQALGPAAEEQVAKLKELTLVERDQSELETMDIDDVLPQYDEDVREVAMDHLITEKAADRMDLDLEGAIVRTGQDKSAVPAECPPSPQSSASKALEELESEPERLPISDETVRTALESLTTAPGPIDLSSYTHLWTLYTSLTASLSITLCESLRLILEPTLATRLRGDFRTGKRLNMRRVIAWVASEYTKDRIWLRRVKPSARAYQVLLAVDDSASMRGGGGAAVHLAYQTVALVSRALGRLEVGEVAVARFGAGWELVHGFGEGARDWGSSPTAGGRVLSALTFRQQRTDVASFLEGSLSVLEAAREAVGTRGAAKDLWQLEIIISDGICQEHERLRRALRRARSMRILVVFIVLDALNTSNTADEVSSSSASAATSASASAQTSILTLNQVSYTQSPTTGQMELNMVRYLDSFPFEYYIVLRDVEALPGVLADTLREFFERVSEE
ncbi:hypothetical protein ID866_6614 [Astraeus odoratus]|nr:hypothetical protein ID866_6614 [Astraeus odoratus]